MKKQIILIMIFLGTTFSTGCMGIRPNQMIVDTKQPHRLIQNQSVDILIPKADGSYVRQSIIVGNDFWIVER